MMALRALSLSLSRSIFHLLLYGIHYKLTTEITENINFYLDEGEVSVSSDYWPLMTQITILLLSLGLFLFIRIYFGNNFFLCIRLQAAISYLPCVTIASI